MGREPYPLPPESRSTICAHEDKNPQYTGLLKIGYTLMNTQSCGARQYPICGEMVGTSGLPAFLLIRGNAPTYPKRRTICCPSFWPA
jgi:hypothetical protein